MPATAPLSETSVPTEPNLPWLASEGVEVPGRPGVSLYLRLDQDHRIFVDRPDIWTDGIPEGPALYVWPLGIPSAKRPTPPATATEVLPKADDAAYTAPLHGAAAAARPGGRLDAATRTAATTAWKDLWKRFVPHLHPAASAVAHQYGFNAMLYSLLARRPDLLDHLKVAPALAPFYDLERLASVPATGWNLQMIVAHLLPPEFRDRETGKVHPGTMSWMRSMTWAADRHPPMPTSPLAWREEARRLVRFACDAGPVLDPNRIKQIKTAQEWLLLHMTLGHPGAREFAPAILQNLESSLRAVDLYLKENPRAPELPAERIRMTLQDVVAWRADMPDIARRITGFKKMVEETVLWDRQVRATTENRAQAIAALRVARQAALDQAARAASATTQLCLDIANEAKSTYRLRADQDPTVQFERPPVTEVSFGPYEMVFLDTPAAMQWESLPVQAGGMSHCVVTHLPSVLRGESIVYSIRERRYDLPRDYEAKIRAFEAAFRQSSADPEQLRKVLCEWKLYELSHRPRGRATVEVNRGSYRIIEARAASNHDIPPDVRAWMTLALSVAAGHVTVEDAEREWDARTARMGDVPRR